MSTTFKMTMVLPWRSPHVGRAKRPGQCVRASSVRKNACRLFTPAILCGFAIAHPGAAEDEFLGYPDAEAKAGGAIQISFRQVREGTGGDPARLEFHRDGVVFHTEAKGEGIDLGPVEIPDPGRYRAYLRAGVGWGEAVHPGHSTVFVAEMDGQPVLMWRALGTGGLFNWEWFDIGQVIVPEGGRHRFVWRNQADAGNRRAQLVFAGLVLAPDPEDPAAEEGVHVSEDGYLRTWLIGGPFGTAGLSAVAPHYEQYYLPVTGAAWMQYRLDDHLRVAWRPYTSPADAVRMDAPETFGEAPPLEWPVGRPAAVYAHLYMHMPGQNDLLFDFDSSGKAEVFLNGRPMRPGREVLAVDAHGGFERREGDPPLRTAATMQGGVNRIMVKLFLPQSKYRPEGQRAEPRETWFRCRFLHLDGRPLPGVFPSSGYAQANVAGAVQYHLDPPDLLVPEDGSRPAPGRRLGDLIDLHLESDRPWNVFLTDEDVNLRMRLSLLDPLARLERFGLNEPSFDRGVSGLQAHWILYDFDGQVAAQDIGDMDLGLDRPGLVPLQLGPLPRGHYTLYCRLQQGTRLVCQLRPKMVTVVDPPALPLPDVHSKFAHSFYYLLNGQRPEDEERYLRLLALAKVRTQIGTVHKWWINEDPKAWVELPPEQRRWPRAPRPESLARAKELGIELIGQLGGFHRGSATRLAAADSGVADQLIINDYYPVGPVDGPQADKIISTYVYETVQKFKPHFRYWRLANELNNQGFTPAELTHLHKLVHGAMKRADPEARLWGGSISTFGIPYTDEMLRLGYARTIDVHDYHYYIWPQADPTYRDMGGLAGLLAVFEKYQADIPLANGEFGCYRSIHPDGARTQAAKYAIGLTVAHTFDQLQWIATHFPTAMEWTANNEDGTFPAFLAYRTAADLLEGVRFTGESDLGDDTACYGFQRPSGSELRVLWSPRERTEAVPGVDAAWTAYDLLGRPLDLAAPGEVPIGPHPVYVTNGRLEEGGSRTPV